jgi:uncharacterized small protein (DUF1192 family)
MNEGHYICACCENKETEDRPVCSECGCELNVDVDYYVKSISEMEYRIAVLRDEAGNDQNFIQNLIAERDQARERVAELEQSVLDFYKLISKWLQKGNLEPMWYTKFETFVKTIYEDANND